MPERETVELEDDPAEMVCHLAADILDSGGQSPHEEIKQQFRDALAKFVDARIAEALKQAKS